MKIAHNITEFTYERTDFTGFRVQATRNGITFRLYISSAGEKSHKNAYRKALKAKAGLFTIIEDANSWRGKNLKRTTLKAVRDLGFKIGHKG